MTKPFIVCNKCDLDLVFKATQSQKNFTFETLNVAQTHFWYWKVFIMCVDTSTQYTHELDQFDLCQSHSNNLHFQGKSMASTSKFM